MTATTSTLTTDGPTHTATLKSPQKRWHTEREPASVLGVMYVSNNFGGGTFNIYVKHPQHPTAIQVQSVSSDSVVKLEYPPGTEVYGQLNGSTSPSLDVTVDT